MRKQFGFGEMLVNEGYITHEQLNEAIELKDANHIKLGKALLELKYVSEDVLVKVLSKQLRVPIIRAQDVEVDLNAVDIIPEKIVRHHQCFPYKLDNNVVKLIVTDPLNLVLEDEIYHDTNLRSELFLGYESEIQSLINHYYGSHAAVEDIDGIEQVDIEDAFDVSSAEDNSPIIRITNSIFKGAVTEGASDIHIGVTEKLIEVRYRIDGILHLNRELPKKAHPALVSRIKTMADMDITEKRIPQDGRIQINLEGNSIDMRVSTLPSVHGEKVTIRLLDKGNLIMDIKQLGFQDKIQKNFENIISSPVGIILITGPTGSGKSSTLYTVINELNDVTKNIITIEDPVEYRLDGIVQVQVNPKAGMTFASGLKAILRQDPDIILIGEIRDKETASIAVKASSTGHLVFATLHTNDAISTIVRLLDMGVEPYLVASTVKGVVNQRLVRRICKDCRVEYKSTSFTEERAFFDIPDGEELTLYKGAGCEKCKHTGYKGRVAIHEMFVMTDETRRMISEGINEATIRDKAIELGMVTLKKDGFEKALKGLTTLEEVKRFVSE